MRATERNLLFSTEKKKCLEFTFWDFSLCWYFLNENAFSLPLLSLSQKKNEAVGGCEMDRKRVKKKTANKQKEKEKA